ncbi:LytR/AlgR family response regulator transcription factor [Anaerobacillus isosaccharinicus]|uniref:DNA-binding response regulator n=1 Tax=Anaerobacillus isosaccharinicus TaxID=1532552 RepID=A0A1S2MF20_9BACI|nr:LytTR family DNA-binding domain-containing protein [Anaerobacillus isosaccharinicus]MBA5586512.1 response regulator transcription factor [Anaerobacillus isosaccharinicus]QOY35247.1 response regulator transcription factor [Anaerobacillus isosaccharinicus]
MIRIAIVEDEIHYQEQLIEFLKKFEEDREEVIEITTYSDGDEFIGKYHAQFDIILMDVQMPLMDGMSAAEEIRKIDSEVVIIFITNMAQYAIRGYAVDALDYVLKPISYFSFSQRLNRAVERMKKREDRFITLKLKGGVTRLKVSDIYYIESQGHKLIFRTKEGEHTTTGTMKELEDELSNHHFFRGHKGYLINLEHVDGMSESCAVVQGEELPVSRMKRKGFMEALADYWGEVIK